MINKHKKIAVIFPKDSDSIFNNKKQSFGGATVQLFNYAVELSKNNDVYCFVKRIDDIDYEKFPNLKFRFTHDKNANYLKKIIKFHKSFRSVKPGIIIQRGLSRFSTFLGFYGRLFGMKYIFMFAHDRECRGRFQRSNRFNSLYPLLLFSANYLIVQNNYQYEHVNNVFTKKKLFKIGNGFPINSLDSSIKKGVLWIARLESWKRPELCIDAAVKNPKIPFIMIAPTDAAEQNKEYALKIYEMARNIKNITILDFVSFKDINKYFAESRIFLNTSIEEGFPNTFIQACINRTPIVSLNVNPDNFITEYIVGEFCENDIDKMNIAIKNIYNNNSVFKNYADHAIEYVKDNHSIEKNTLQLEKLFI
jgi:glycosyltransferase involved in cell wall biosynthesis